MNIANTIPIILDIFILIIHPNVIFKTLKSSDNGSDNPNSCPYASHHNQLTLDASSPNNPPITRPDNKNTSNIQKFFSFVAIFVPPFLTDF